jgi:hypothetical protein
VVLEENLADLAVGEVADAAGVVEPANFEVEGFSKATLGQALTRRTGMRIHCFHRGVPLSGLMGNLSPGAGQPRRAFILRSCFSGDGGLASSARRMAPPHAGDDVGVAFKLGDVDFTAPSKPRQAKLAMSRGGANVDLFISRPSALFPISLAVKNEQVIVVV